MLYCHRICCCKPAHIGSIIVHPKCSVSYKAHRPVHNNHLVLEHVSIDLGCGRDPAPIAHARRSLPAQTAGYKFCHIGTARRHGRRRDSPIDFSHSGRFYPQFLISNADPNTHLLTWTYLRIKKQKAWGHFHGVPRFSRGKILLALLAFCTYVVVSFLGSGPKC